MTPLTDALRRLALHQDIPECAHAADEIERLEAERAALCEALQSADGARREIERLTKLVERQRHDIRWTQVAAEERNRQLDALHLVWCDGGCHGGIHRHNGGTKNPEDVLALADEAQRNIDRMRRWAANARHRAEKAAHVRQILDGGAA